MMFFKSLLPFVSKIPMEKKLILRSRIQQVVEKFAFMVGPLQQLSPGTSTGGRPTPQPSPSLSTSSYDSRPPSVDKYNQNYGYQPDTQSFPRHEESFPQHEEEFSGLNLLPGSKYSLTVGAEKSDSVYLLLSACILDVPNEKIIPVKIGVRLPVRRKSARRCSVTTPA
ncbi:hypothetical protein J6590_062915 [Homalodisca vitripennis]|nr:hypothetical protein J6590_062915 [Homalodisca vitripennis]